MNGVALALLCLYAFCASPHTTRPPLCLWCESHKERALNGVSKFLRVLELLGCASLPLLLDIKHGSPF